MGGKGWFDGKVSGVKVQIGVECPGDHNQDNGDHVIAVQGSKCKLVCKAENGKEYRVDTTKADFQCTNPLPSSLFEVNGCTNDCVGKWIKEGLNMNGDIPYRYDRQTSTYSPNWLPDMEAMVSDSKLNKCHKVQSTMCPADIPMTADEIAAGISKDAVIWDCTDGNNPGSVCTKSCAAGYNPSGKKQTKSCDCTKNCDWKNSVSSCVPAVCALPDNDRRWPDATQCFDKDDNLLDFDKHGNVLTGIGFPEGTYCTEVCAENYTHYMSGKADVSHCTCDASSGRCTFSDRYLNWCTPAVCSIDTSWIY